MTATMAGAPTPDGGSARLTEATSVTAQGPGRYLAELDAEISVAGKLNGGYLLAVLVRAAMAEVAADEGAWLPVASTAHYLGPAAPGPAQIGVQVLRRGGSTAQARAWLEQGGTVFVEAAVTLARGRAGAAWSDGPVVELPPEADCYPMSARTPGAPFETPLMEVIDERLDPACLGFGLGRPTGAGQLRGWVRIPGQPAADAAGLIVVADALPPAVFDLGHLGWVPTLSLTVHVTGLPVPGPLRVRQQVHGMDSGVLTQVCDIWDDAGSLVTHAVQLAALPAGRRPSGASRP